MKNVTNYLLMGIVAIAMFVGYGCSSDAIDDNEIHYHQSMDISQRDISLLQSTNEALESLELRYGVEIENTKNLMLSDDDIKDIEQEIIKLQTILNISEENIPLYNMGSVLKTRSVDTMTVSTRAFNLTWLYVAVSVDNDTTCKIDPWCAGIYTYNFTYHGVYHDFSPGHNQAKICFGFTLVATTSITDMIGVNITEQADVNGHVDFTTKEGSVSVDTGN